MLAALSVLWGTNWPVLKVALNEIDPYLLTIPLLPTQSVKK